MLLFFFFLIFMIFYYEFLLFLFIFIYIYVYKKINYIYIYINFIFYYIIYLLLLHYDSGQNLPRRADSRKQITKKPDFFWQFLSIFVLSGVHIGNLVFHVGALGF